MVLANPTYKVWFKEIQRSSTLRAASVGTATSNGTSMVFLQCQCKND